MNRYERYLEEKGLTHDVQLENHLTNAIWDLSRRISDVEFRFLSYPRVMIPRAQNYVAFMGDV